MLQLNFYPFPEFSTKRLLLRRLIPADAPDVRGLRSNVEVMKYINRPLTLTQEDAEKWIQNIDDVLQKNDGISWAICLVEAPATHVGNIGLWRIEKENYRAEIGYMLEPALQNKGLMYEALMSVVHYGFDSMKLHSIEGRIDPENIPSGKLLQKAGFTMEGLFKKNYFLHGRFANTAVYSLLTPHQEV